MTAEEAVKHLDELFSKPNVPEEDEPLFVECLTLLANMPEHELCGEAQYYLGDFYYYYHRYDLAIRYWELSGENGFTAAWAGIADLYFFGKGIERDYEKAFYYFSKGAEKDNEYCQCMLADMYRDGLYVAPNRGKYKELIEELYFKESQSERSSDVFPDIILRLARIRKEDNETEQAIALYREALVRYKKDVSVRKYTAYIKRILEATEELYALTPFDLDPMDIYSISYLMKKPVRIIFMYKDKSYEIETFSENTGITVRFENKWFRTVEDFYLKAEICERSITTLVYDLYGFEVIG